MSNLLVAQVFQNMFGFVSCKKNGDINMIDYDQFNDADDFCQKMHMTIREAFNFCLNELSKEGNNDDHKSI